MVSTSAFAELNTVELFDQVLLVEDEPSHAKLVTRALEGVVGRVNHVATGQAAVQALSSSLPELVFCDLLLPDTSGLVLLETIRAMRPGLPIIVMTSSNKIEDAVAAMRQGAWDYMVKEFSPDFSERVQLLVRRVGERKIQEMRELQVRAERDAFSQAVRSAQDGLAVVETDGTVVFANEAFEKFVQAVGGGGVSPENVLHIVGATDSAIADQLRTQFDQAPGEGGFWRSELKVSHPAAKDNLYYELMLTSFRLGVPQREGTDPLSAAHLRRHVVWIRNISEKKAQEKFQRDILATTSHDLKGPLGAIATSVELLTQYLKAEEPVVQDLVMRIGSCARNCISLIDELLSARRIQDGVMVIKPRVYEAAEILEDIVLDYLPMAKAKSIQLSSRPLTEPLAIYADRMGLQRVLGNLVGNAIKFTPRGGSVELSAARQGNAVVLSVADTGPGIESEARHKLFERYTRLDKHQEVDGAGLGLFVTKSIVDAHDGKIEIVSEVGKGTTFRVSFPDEREVSNAEQTSGAK